MDTNEVVVAPVACTLAPPALDGRMSDWQDVLALVSRRERIDDGVRVTFGPDLRAGELLRLAIAEQECCAFFRFAITVDSRGVALEVRAPAEARPILTSLFGEPS